MKSIGVSYNHGHGTNGQMVFVAVVPWADGPTPEVRRDCARIYAMKAAADIFRLTQQEQGELFAYGMVRTGDGKLVWLTADPCLM